MSSTVGIYGIKDNQVGKYPNNTHDHNICIMDDGEIVSYLALERYTRRKHDNRLDLFIEDLIESDLDIPKKFDIIFVNSFEGNAFNSKSGKIKFESSRLFPYPPTIVENCFCKLDNIKSYTRFEPNSFLLSHELAHIFTNLPFHGEFLDNSLLIHFDGGASVSNFSAFLYKNRKLHFIEADWKFSQLSKLFYDNALVFAILGENREMHQSVPGKLMGYAAFGTPSERLEKWLIKNSFFKDIWDNPSTFFRSVYDEFNIKLSNFDKKNPFLQDIAATIQSYFERVILDKLEQLKKKYNPEYFYYSGGSALNINLNTKIVESKLFKEVFIPPAPNDSGLSIGAAAFLEWKKGKKIKPHLPYLNNVGLKYEKRTFEDSLIIQVAHLLLSNKIIGICNGFGEAGPRALGNRSIIALPSSPELTKKVSMECKGREWYRPIAPIMLKSVADKVIDGETYHKLSKYMLLNYTISKKYLDYLRGVIHIDGTSRIQTLDNRDENPFMFDLLSYLYRKHNIYGLINTSFNYRGEPIVHTPEDALESAKKMNIDAIVINYKLINLEGI